MSIRFQIKKVAGNADSFIDQFGQRAKSARAPSFLRIRNIRRALFRRNEPSDQDIPRVFKRICAGRQRNQPVARLGLNWTFEIGFRLHLFDKRALIAISQQ